MDYSCFLCISVIERERERDQGTMMGKGMGV